MRGPMRIVLPLVLVAAVGAGAAIAATGATRSAATVRLAKSQRFGSVLADASGRTLYRYTPDRKGVSTCKTGCIGEWPKAVVKATARLTAGPGLKRSLLGTIKASNGMRQLTYGGFPLYRFAGDGKAGQVNGEGYDSLWYVVNAKGTLVRKATAGGGATTTTSGGTTTDSGGGGGEAWG